jgi:hypothetical protein
MKELQTALAEQLRRGEEPTAELAGVLQRVAHEAREKNLRPEELLIALKQLWNSLSETLRPQSSDQFERVRQNLVTLCIKAYYAE